MYYLKAFYFKQIFDGRDSLRFFVAGMTAEIVSCLLWLPIDITKERLQVNLAIIRYNKYYFDKVQTNLKTYYYKNSIDAAKQIIKTDGILGLYKVEKSFNF